VRFSMISFSPSFLSVLFVRLSNMFVSYTV